MAKDLAVSGWEDRPGVNAAIGEALGGAGINIDGTFGSGRLGEIHVLVEDEAGAAQALGDAGFTVGEPRDVLVLDIEDRPGAWGALARRLADAGVNIDFHYLTTTARVAIGVDDLDKARAAV
jgi:hypothetical protein